MLEFKNMKNTWYKIGYFLKEDKRSTMLWLAIRLYVGWQWLSAGYGKITSSAWVGSEAGTALTGFLNNSLTKNTGPHPDVKNWYAWLIENVFLPIAPFMSYMIVAGEILIGITLIIGLWTKRAAILGAFMNLNFLLAGTVGINPILLMLSLFLTQTKKSGEYYSVDGLLKSKKAKAKNSSENK